MKRTKCCRFHNHLDKKFPEEINEENDSPGEDEDEFLCGRMATTIERSYCCKKCPSQIKIIPKNFLK